MLVEAVHGHNPAPPKLLIVHFTQYKDQDVIEKLKEATGNSVHIALDAISSDETNAFTVRVLEEGAKGRIITLMPATDRIKVMREDVDIICTCSFRL
jgi:D-arabinose 1-dehydrogenase-like Zn-dependent alcohol dehydrogenase